jgi:hypothetical protein
MQTLREFLRDKAREDDQRERLRCREEWITAVDHLIHQLRAWLEEADSEKLLMIYDQEYDKLEQGLGMYKISGLNVGLRDSLVKIIPVSRSVVGSVESQGDAGVRAEGRVDISDGMRKYILYRTLRDGRDQWYVLDEQYKATVLDQARFEEIMQNLLS